MKRERLRAYEEKKAKNEATPVFCKNTAVFKLIFNGSDYFLLFEVLFDNDFKFLELCFPAFRADADRKIEHHSRREALVR